MVAMRPLDTGEASGWKAFPGSFYNKVEFIIAYEGELDVGALEAAFISLVDKYPALGATVRASGGYSHDYVWDISEDAYPSFAVIDGGWDAMRSLSKRRKDRAEYDSMWENYKGRKILTYGDSDTNDLVNLVLFREKDRGYILLGISHVIFAAAQLHAYIPELLSFYTNIVTGSQVATDKQPFPISKERLQKIYEATLGKDNVARTSNRDTKSARTAEEAHWGCERIIKLSQNATNCVVTSARKNHVKVPSIIGSAMALAMRTSANLKDTDPFYFNVGVDMGRRLGFRPTEVFWSNTSHQVVVDMSADLQMTGLAHNLQRKIDNLEVVVTPPVLRAPDITLNNQGVFPTFAHPEGIKWTDFVIETWIRKAANWDDFDSENANGYNMALLPCWLVFHTFNGELRIWLKLREDINVEVADNFLHRLHEFCNVTELSQVVHLDRGASW